MKKYYWKYALSIILSIILATTLVLPSFAVSNTINDNSKVYYNYSSTEIDFINQTYNSLDDEAKAIFHAVLASNQELLNFHLQYVDTNASIEDYTLSTQNSSRSTSNAITILANELSALSLPSSIEYALNALGSALASAIADGPLLVGDIYALTVVAATSVTIATHWDDVCDLWNDIVDAFTLAFSDIEDNIVDEFPYFKQDIIYEYEYETSSSSIEIVQAGQKVTINGTVYRCTTLASDITLSQINNMKPNDIYVAVLSSGVLYVCMTKINRAIAYQILKQNSSSVGTLSKLRNTAEALANGGTEHPAHYTDEGYFAHFHPTNYPRAHSWYIT